jgi:hypothetical protein
VHFKIGERLFFMKRLTASTPKSSFDLRTQSISEWSIDAIELTDEDLEKVSGSFFPGFGLGGFFPGFGLGGFFPGFGLGGFFPGFGLGGFFPGFGLGGFFPGFGFGFGGFAANQVAVA